MRTILRIFLLLACCFCTWLACSYHNQKIISKIENANIIVISKQDMQLNLINYKGDTLFCAPIAVGKAYGNKQNKGTCVLQKEYLKSLIFKMRQNGHMIFMTERRNRGSIWEIFHTFKSTRT